MTYQDYLLDHSLNEEFVTKKLGWVLSDTKITIPIYGADGKLLYCKYRHLDFAERKAAGDRNANKFSFDLGGHPVLYCVHKIKNLKEVVLAEGEIDAARLWQDDIPAVTSTGGVKTFSSLIAAPLTKKTVYITLDTDKAGVSEVEKYYQVLESVGAHPLIIDIPAEYKDVSVYFTLNKNATVDFKNLMSKALNLDEWLDAHEPDDFKVETATELLADQLPEEEWLIDRVIPSEGFVFIAGAEATGKSFYTLTMANSLVTGSPWLDKFPIKKKVKVLFIDKENTRRRIQSRLRGLGIEDPDNMIYRVKYPHYFELADEKEDDGLSRFAKSLSRRVVKWNIGLIIIDSFTDVMVGNENAAGDVQGFFDAMRRLFPNRTILVLHHESKPAPGVPRTSSQRFRGSTNITAQIVVGFRVESIPKSNGEFTMEQTKSGDAEKIQKFKVIMKVEPLFAGSDKTKVTALKYGGEVFDQAQKVAETMEMIIDALSDAPLMSRTQIMDMTLGEGESETTTRRALKQLMEDGIIDETQDGRNKSYMLLKRPETTENEEIPL